jgi:predicted acyl esterase
MRDETQSFKRNESVCVSRGSMWAQRVSLILVSLASATALADDSGYPWRETGYLPVAVGTADETLLMYQVMFPNPDVWGPGPYATVLDYSGYEPATTIFDGLDDRFLAAGYAVAGVNIRGTHGSGGTFNYFEPLEARDGADTIEWLATRPWSNGSLAMVGKSWPGISQLYVAAERPPSLKAIVPGSVITDLYRDVAFPGGVMNVTFCSYWSLARVYEGYLTGPIYFSESQDQQALLNQFGHLPNVLFNPFVQMVVHHYDDSFYRERSNWYFVDQIQVPTFLVQSWQDEQVGSRAAHLLERLSPDVEWRFAATNGDHGEYYGEDMFPHILRFLSYHLKQEIPAGEQQMVTVPLLLPNGKPHPNKTVTRPETYQEAFARYNAENPVVINWENGAQSGRRSAWSQTYAEWPAPNQTPWRLYLHTDGTLKETGYPSPPLGWLLGLLSPRSLGAADYLFSPLVGVQERGGYNIEAPLVGVEAVPAGDWNDRPPQGTFLEFTTTALTADKALLGSASVDLYVSSTAVDTDFEVTISEIRPDGYEVFVQQGWLRASHRKENPSLSTELRPYHTHQLIDATLLIPDQPTKVRIEIFPFGHVFRAGSKIRIGITAPHTHPDLWGFAALPLPAKNTIYMSQPFKSSIVLPLLAGDVAHTPYPPVNSLRNQPFRVAMPTVAPGGVGSIPSGDTAFVNSWIAEVSEALGAGELIVPTDAVTIPSGDFNQLAEWFDAWFEGAGIVIPTAPAGVSQNAYVDWQTYVAATPFDPAQSDAWFVQWFDTWYSGWLAAH